MGDCWGAPPIFPPLEARLYETAGDNGRQRFVESPPARGLARRSETVENWRLAEEAGVEPTEDTCAPSNGFEARAPHRERYSSARQNCGVRRAGQSSRGSDAGRRGMSLLPDWAISEHLAQRWRRPFRRPQRSW